MAKDKRDGETEQQEQLEALDPRFHQLVDGSASIEHGKRIGGSPRFSLKLWRRAKSCRLVA